MLDGIGLIIQNQKNEVLLHLRDESTSRYPGQWCLIGGRCEKDELPEQAAVRELKEETGLSPKTMTFFKNFNTRKGKQKVHIFVVSVDTSEEGFILSEGRDARFIQKDSAIKLINELDYSNEYLEVLKEYSLL